MVVQLVEKNAAREKRIHDEIIVDANGPEEQAMGWYYYLQDTIHFPFTAHCIVERPISVLRVGDEITVVGMAPTAECEHEMFVEMRWENRRLALPLSQLEPILETDEETSQAVADWYYWVQRKYAF